MSHFNRPLVLSGLSLCMICCKVTDSPVQPSYPYLELGQDTYKDKSDFHPHNSGTTLEEVFRNSHFSKLPEFEQAISEGRVEHKDGDQFVIVGDGGFGGIRLIRGDDFPQKMIVVFPDIEVDRTLVVERVAGGWKIVSASPASGNRVRPL